MSDPEPLDYATPRPSPAALGPRGRGAIALAGTLFFPGVGHAIVGDRKAAFRWALIMACILAISVVALASPLFTPAMLVLLPAQIIGMIACLISAYRTARRTRHPLLGGPARRYLAAAGLLLAAVFLNPQIPVSHFAKKHLAEAFVMPTVSMSPTVQPGDRFLVHKSLEPRRWDVVAFVSPDGPARPIYIKRLIGLPGETIEIHGGVIVINGRAHDGPEGIGPWVGNPPAHIGGPRNGCEGNPIKLGADEYYLLGDNSPVSGDSRFWTAGSPGHQPGTIGRADIIGRATWTYWPPKHWRSLQPP